MYISPSKALAHLDRLAAWQAGEKPAPVTVEFDLSNRCSLGCVFCHFAHTHTRGPWAGRNRDEPAGFTTGGDLADTALVLRVLGELAEAGVRGVVWSGGGEPTLHPAWESILEHAHALGLEQGMYTLGGHLSAAKAATLARCATWIVVSLDCADPDTYASEKGVPPNRFEAALDGISHLVAAGGAVVGVSFLMHRDNWFEAPRMLALARRFGASYATFRPTILTSPTDPATVTEERSWITEALPLFRELAAEADVELDPERFAEYRDWQGRSYPTCYGIRLNTTITPDGRVWVCPQRRGVEGSCLGDLREESFGDLWARHPGEWTDFAACRAMCRLHLTNETLATVYEPRQHEAFV